MRPRFLSGDESTEAEDLRHRMVLLCNREPQTRRGLMKALESTEKRIYWSLTILRNKRQLVERSDGRRLWFMTPKLFQRLHPLEVLPWQDASQAPEIVRTPGYGANWAPTVEPVQVDGLVVQRWSSPPDRWAVQLPAGGGVISQDHQLRREGWEVGSRWAQYVGEKSAGAAA